MKNLKIMFAAITMVLITAALNAAEPKTYQVTGPVLDLTPTVITVQKNAERWELARDKNTAPPLSPSKVFAATRNVGAFADGTSGKPAIEPPRRTANPAAFASMRCG